MLAAIAGMLILAIVPLVPIPGGSDWSKPVTGGAVQASPRMVFNIEQPVVLARTPFLELERGKFSLQAGADGTGERRLVLEGATLRLDAGPGQDAPNRPDIFSPLMTQLAALGMDRVLIRGAMLRYSADPNARVGPIDAELDLANRGQMTLRGVVIFHGDAVSFEASAGQDTEANSDGGRNLASRRRASFSAKGENLGDVRFEGELSNRNGLTGDIEAKLASPAALMRWLGAPVRQAAALRNVSISGRARWLDGMFDLQDARLTLDGQRPAMGALRLRYRNARPIIEGTLAFATLDLTRLGATEDVATGQASQSPSAIDGPLRAMLAALTRDLPAYLDIDADLRISATTVLLRSGIRGRGAATITVDRGLLTAELAEVEWAGNKARLHIDAGGQSWRPAFNVRGRVDLAQAQDHLTPLFGQGLVIGPASVTLDLQGRGDGPNLLPGVMTGKITVGSTVGARSQLDPFKVTERTAARPARENPLVLSAGQAVEAIDLRLLLTDRMIVFEPSQIKTGTGIARISGKIDRSSLALDLVLSRSVRPRTAPRGGVAPESTEQSFGITGSWNAPNVTRLALP